MGDDDRHWLAGTLYINREDPRILVPKRRGLGIGHTLNLGHPVSWLILVALVAIAAVVGATAHH